MKNRRPGILPADVIILLNCCSLRTQPGNAGHKFLPHRVRIRAGKAGPPPVISGPDSV